MAEVVRSGRTGGITDRDSAGRGALVLPVSWKCEGEQAVCMRWVRLGYVTESTLLRGGSCGRDIGKWKPVLYKTPSVTCTESAVLCGTLCHSLATSSCAPQPQQPGDFWGLRGADLRTWTGSAVRLNMRAALPRLRPAGTATRPSPLRSGSQTAAASRAALPRLCGEKTSNTAPTLLPLTLKSGRSQRSLRAAASANLRALRGGSSPP